MYFNTIAFNSKKNHSYAKLVPEAFNDDDFVTKHLRESEGELSIDALKLQVFIYEI